jgi:DNA-binding transcriptional ArsR family regulator
MSYYKPEKKKPEKGSGPKTSKQLERYFKGAANHHRIAILLVVEREPGITVDLLTERIDGNMKTISQHTHSLVRAGLLNKAYKGRMVAHELSPYGRRFTSFIKSF